MDPQLTIALIGFAGIALGAILTFTATRGKTKTDAKTALDERIDARVKEQLEGAWGEIGTLKEAVRELTEKDFLKSGAFARILRAIARQWPNEQGPDLDPSDIALIEETIPPHWIRRARKDTP